MESQNIEFRAVIKFLTKEGVKAKEMHRRMADVYGDSSPKYSTVAKWSAEFKHGQDSVEDDPRPGCPADVISQEMIDRVDLFEVLRPSRPNGVMSSVVSLPNHTNLLGRLSPLSG